MSPHNIGFYEEISKNIPELSSNMHLISSSGNVLKRRKKICFTIIGSQTQQELIRFQEPYFFF